MKNNNLEKFYYKKINYELNNIRLVNQKIQLFIILNS